MNPNPLINVTYTCFPAFNQEIININDFNRGFPAEFLITQWWALYPGLETALYWSGSIQLVLAVAGVILAVGRGVDVDLYGVETYAFHKIIPLLTSTWQLALSGLILLLPSQWLSNVTMGMILYHAWSEFFALVLRFLIVHNKVKTTQAVDQYVKYMILFGVVTGVPFMLTSNPYIQGIITAIPVLPADFLNLFLAPYLNIKWVLTHPSSKPAEKVSEILSGILYVLHVIWFYGQGLIACLVSIEAGAQFFVAFQFISTAVFFAIIVSYCLTVREFGEWNSPKDHFISFFCCLSGTDVSIKDTDQEEATPIKQRKHTLSVGLHNGDNGSV